MAPALLDSRVLSLAIALALVAAGLLLGVDTTRQGAPPSAVAAIVPIGPTTQRTGAALD
jgi:hypothetical protein